MTTGLSRDMVIPQSLGTGRDYLEILAKSSSDSSVLICLEIGRCFIMPGFPGSSRVLGKVFLRYLSYDNVHR